MSARTTRKNIAPEGDQRRTRQSCNDPQPRRYIQPPKAIGDASESAVAMLELSRKIVARIKSNRTSLNCGSYLMADENRKIYVLREASVSTLKFLQAHARWLVGFYAGNNEPQPGAEPRQRQRVRIPDAGDIFDDLVQHFRDIKARPAA